MTRSFSYAELLGILSRFRCQRSSQQVATPGSLHGYSWHVNYNYSCNMCKEDDKFSFSTNNSRLYAMSTMPAKDLAFFGEMFEHLFTKHNVVPCNICGDLITQRGMKRHQNAPACQGELRRYELQNRGLARLPFAAREMIPSLISNRLENLERLVDWQDENVLHNIEQAASAAKHQMLTDLGIKTCQTMWNPDFKKYDKEFWAHPITAHFLSLVDSTVKEEEEKYSVLNQWIQADENSKDAILGILELKKEGFT